MEQEEKSEGGGMRKIAAFIVDKRNLFFLLYVVALVFCLFSRNWVEVENDITTYLPEETETRRGLTVMNDNFITYGSARVMITNVTQERAQALADQVADLDGHRSAAGRELRWNGDGSGVHRRHGKDQ